MHSCTDSTSVYTFSESRREWSQNLYTLSPRGKWPQWTAWRRVGPQGAASGRVVSPAGNQLSYRSPEGGPLRVEGTVLFLPCLWSALPVFYLVCGPPYLCFTSYVVHLTCVLPRLWSTLPVFYLVCSPPYLCFTSSVVHLTCVLPCM